ncbi:prolipoprotein diacylglyceryl transferase [Sulfuricella sp. T08]|uniref:prolipoprotein diacylglyceryl transferase n=1 Tax=Sulfuricella sp. T08 TaxID=1632857 RepID=UPI0006179EAA|nr:prolipoprotein diacylglyceryl transferase [Sulfuricella sp. T08]GAO37305.1 prolipoprotein diacylglyceryl transferase [Sulfuricella sp. T08]
MLIHPQFDPVALHLGPLAIRWYGLMYLLAFGLFLLLGRQRIKTGPQPGWDARQLDDLLFYGVLGVVLGGRLGYVLFYQPAHFLAHPLEIFSVWQGGMAFHGGLLGVLAAMWLFARKTGKSWLTITDFIAPLVPLGLGAGRIGNFINGELWGRPSDMPWAVVFPQIDNVARHPSQLYQFALEGLALFTLLWLFSRKPRPTGAVSGLFLIGYGSFRFLVEYTREPDSFLGLLALNLSMGQWLSLPMVVAGIVMLRWAYRKGV